MYMYFSLLVIVISVKLEIFEYQLFNDSRPISSQELKREKELHAKVE